MTAAAAPATPVATMPVTPQTPVMAAAPSAPEAPAGPREAMVVTDLAPLAPLAAPATSSTPSAPSSAAAGFWVQLGAFRERDGAESLRNQAARGLPTLASQLRVFSEAGTHRLQAGPFPSRNAAGDAVTQLRDSLRIAPMVIERR
jgi:rare lipoprotein A